MVRRRTGLGFFFDRNELVERARRLKDFVRDESALPVDRDRRILPDPVAQRIHDEFPTPDYSTLWKELPATHRKADK